MDHEYLSERSFDARVAAWSRWGTVDREVLSMVPTPAPAGPRWPGGRQSYLVARRPREILLASDGLSDPFHRGPGVNGLGHEFFATTIDRVDPIAGTWLWDLVWQISNRAADHGGWADLLDDLHLVSTELYDVRVPRTHARRFVTPDQRIGVLAGLTGSAPPAVVAGPLSRIRLINVKLLTADELAFIVTYGADGRYELARRFANQGGLLTSSLDRPSVV